jgi:hypothetical protein
MLVISPKHPEEVIKLKLSIQGSSIVEVQSIKRVTARKICVGSFTLLLGRP